MVDPDVRVRRRGDVLHDAVFDATIVELAEVGVRGASMERIANRAGTGKAALYRRWPNVRALALDVFISTLDSALPTPDPTTGSLRGDLLASLTTLAAHLNGDLGIILRELISEAAHDPALIGQFQSRFGMRKQLELITLLEQAMLRGEIPRQAIDPAIIQIPAALLVHQLVLTGTAPTAAEVEHILDRIVLPLLHQPFVAPTAT